MKEKKNEKKIYVVIPAFNEESTIADVIEDTKKQGYENIIVVDDGSTDSTYQAAIESGAYVLRHFLNRGPGAATQTGLSYAKLQNADFAVTLDGDGQHDPKDIEKLITEADSYDIVFGSRFLNKSNKIPWQKRFFNKVADLITFLLSTKLVSDSQSGFKVFSKKGLNEIYITTSGFEFCTEIFMQIRAKNLKFKEIPITVDYHIASQQKGQNFATGITTLFKLFVEAMTR